MSEHPAGLVFLRKWHALADELFGQSTSDPAQYFWRTHSRALGVAFAFNAASEAMRPLLQPPAELMTELHTVEAQVFGDNRKDPFYVPRDMRPGAEDSLFEQVNTPWPASFTVTKSGIW
jgi:hypothetical protein